MALIASFLRISIWSDQIWLTWARCQLIKTHYFSHHWYWHRNNHKIGDDVGCSQYGQHSSIVLRTQKSVPSWDSSRGHTERLLRKRMQCSPQLRSQSWSRWRYWKHEHGRISVATRIRSIVWSSQRRSSRWFGILTYTERNVSKVAEMIRRHGSTFSAICSVSVGISRSSTTGEWPVITLWAHPDAGKFKKLECREKLRYIPARNIPFRPRTRS